MSANKLAEAGQSKVDDPESVVRGYHERTKHHLDRYARGPETLDWEHQPDPFRQFAGCTRIPLPYPALITPDARPDQNGISTLLRYAFGLTAWKALGPDRWSLRCNPSSGNLHPTEAYLACRGINGIDDGVYHYLPLDHSLEQRCVFGEQGRQAETELLIGLTSIPWREAWKYGERAYRYCQLDIGHALGSLRYAALVNGWRVELLPWADPVIASLLGLDRSADFAAADPESPDLLVRIRIANEIPVARAEPQRWLEACENGHWQGGASPVGGQPRLNWPLIDEVAASTWRDRDWPEASATDPVMVTEIPAHQLAQLTLQRRSAQAFDCQSTLPRETFYAMLTKLLPRAGNVPWDSWPERARIHLFLFIHRVEGLPKGLYCLIRHPDALVPLRDTLRSELAWEPPEGCPPTLPLYRLVAADSRKAARTLSCHQEIASSSSFSLAMIAEYERVLEDQGPAAYRHLYWEAGLIGQVLYLQAEQAGFRGTGIGCFFDDAVHETLGIEGSRYQSLYHFTVGAPKEDPRILAFPPYEHIARRQMAELRAAISELYAKRESLKTSLEAGQSRPQTALRELEALDAELSDLDTRFKALWDENGDL